MCYIFSTVQTGVQNTPSERTAPRTTLPSCTDLEEVGLQVHKFASNDSRVLLLVLNPLLPKILPPLPPCKILSDIHNEVTARKQASECRAIYVYIW